MIQSKSKRASFLLGAAAFLLTLLYLQSTHSPSWQTTLQVVDLGNLLPEDDEPTSTSSDADLGGSTRKVSVSGGGMDPNMADPFTAGFVPGDVKPPGSNYTRNLVVAKTIEEKADWLDTEDMRDVQKLVYVVDDHHAPLHPPINKGHEVMVYWTYIIDHYDDLPDVSIFMHSHQYSWHENDLLGFNAAEMIKRLSSERVQREGYMNLRCHWMPGCPDWMHPGTIEEDPWKEEETAMARVWGELFPNRPLPETLAQPCCAQFALSKQRIRALTRETYLFYREWLMRTKLEDEVSGRVWEYLWQVVFTGQTRFCPNQWSCYCDGYGVCFESEGMFDYWFELRYNQKKLQKELAAWKEKAGKLEEYRRLGKVEGTEGSDLEISSAGRDLELQAEIDRLGSLMEDGKKKALDRGQDPQFRAKSAGRDWSVGDGY